MTKTLTPSEVRREQRAARIQTLARRNADKFGTKLELYLHIAKEVGCSHITVYKTLRGVEL